MDAVRCQAFVDEIWGDSIVPALVDYIRIPNQSPHFDPGWAEAGHMDAAVALVEAWIGEHAPSDLVHEVVRLPGRTPLVLLEIPGTIDDTVLLYGHLDKQPPMHGWHDDLGPWKPVLRDGRLYGRGGADDGYAVFASLTALLAVREQGLPHARCVVMIECCEESGSYDLPAYIEALLPRIGMPSLVVCLDSGCGNYEQLWSTTSLRGNLVGTLSVDVLNEGVHSGDASGVVPSSFRVLRQLLDRIEDARTGRLLLDALHVEIPADRVAQAKLAAAELGERVFARFPWVGEPAPMHDDPAELVLNRTWRPTLSITGQDGMPSIAQAGNVLRPRTALKLSLRLPPTCNGKAAVRALVDVLERDPPRGARVRFEGADAADGWNAPPLAPWLGSALERASQASFGRPACFMGEGGTIPFMGMLGARFPQAQFLITGVLGPGSNAHGPNEFLDLPTARRLTACVASVLVDHATRR